MDSKVPEAKEYTSTLEAFNDGFKMGYNTCEKYYQDKEKQVAIDFCEWRMKQPLRFLRDEAGMFPQPKYTLEDEFNKYLQSKQ